MTRKERPNPITIEYAATADRGFDRKVSASNGVPLGQFLQELDSQVENLGEIPAHVNVVTGRGFDVLVGFGRSQATILFTDGVVNQREASPAPKFTDRVDPYTDVEVVESGSYVAWIGEQEVKGSGRHGLSKFHLQTPLKSPEFRMLVKEVAPNLKNIVFNCEYWGSTKRK